VTDTVVRGGIVMTTGGERRADIAISEGRIVEIGPDLPGAREEIDARGLAVLPGVIDVHLHFNEPGRVEWEGAATGSRALAAGGGTLFFDMPLNSTPCTVNAREFDRKHAALEAASVADFGLWGGLVPGALGEMPEMAERGVVGFKAFMCNSGLPEFPRADDATLLEGMKRAASLGLPVAVHAESEELTSALSRRAVGTGVRDFLASRPMVAELDAIQRALLFAAETRAKLHIAHISAGRGVAMAAEARARRGRLDRDVRPLSLVHRGRSRAAGRCRQVRTAAADRRRPGGALERAAAGPRGHRRLRSFARRAVAEAG
jgi:allantoinase